MPLTVLTVDDSRTMRDMLKHSLVAAGFRVLQAEDGIDGLEVLKTEMPDVIVTDINMPRLDGFRLYRSVATRCRTTRAAGSRADDGGGCGEKEPRQGRGRHGMDRQAV